MNNSEDLDKQKTYDKCKYIVKVWEHKFTRKHKRPPSKLDIREAPTDVRHAYRKYFKLKTAALEESFMDVEGLDYEENSNIVDDNQEMTVESELLPGLQLSNDNFTEEVQDESTDTCNQSTYLLSTEISSDNQATESVWGEHLNKSKAITDKKITKESGPSKPVLSISKKLFCGSKFGKSKRNPHKSLSLSQKKNSDVSSESPSFLSQPDSAFSLFKSEEAVQSLKELTDNSALLKFCSTAPARPLFSQSVAVNVVDSILEHKNKKIVRNVDQGWLKRVTEKTGIAFINPELPFFDKIAAESMANENQTKVVETKLDYNSDDIIGESDDELSFSRNVTGLHVAKKSRLCISQTSCNGSSLLTPMLNKSMSSEDNLVTDNPNISLKENITNNIPEGKSDNQEPIIKNITDNSQVISNISEVSTRQDTTKSEKKTVKQHTRKKNPKKTKSVSRSETSQTRSVDSTSLESSPLRRSTRENKVKASFEELPSSEEDPFASDNDEKDPEYVLGDEKNQKSTYGFLPEIAEEQLEESTQNVTKKIQKKKKHRPIVKSSAKNSKKKQLTSSQEDSQTLETDTYELEYNVKPRVVASRFGSIKNIIKNKLLEQVDNISENQLIKNDHDKGSILKDKRQQAKEKLEQRIASGNLNDNFVTINLRKKVFARGKKGLNFSKYKKSQWKSKKKALYGPDMDMGGCDGGKLVCFNCGQEGHFAQRCKATKGDELLSLEAGKEEDECTLPSLEEATQMATESTLSIRKPKLTQAKESEQTKIDNPVSDNSESSGSEWIDDVDEEQLLAEVAKLEEHVKKLDVQEYMDNVKAVNPYYNIKEDGTLIDTPNEVFDALNKFGFKSFRPGQEKTIMRILSGKSTLVTLSTGSGKSLCYQIPAYIYSQKEPCISLVISPLVSLMEDQVTGIPKFLKAACLHTNQTEAHRKKILEAISTGDLNVLLISPEAVVAGEKRTGFGSLFRKLPPIAFACIDEAHCVSQWSHNFRPSYLLICRVLKESLGVRTILGLTATATKTTCESIVQSLGILDGGEGIISDVPLPNNLILTVSKDLNRDRALLNLLLSDRFKPFKSIIVYCTRREECERIATFLRTSLKNDGLIDHSNSKKRKRLNLQAEPYHAGLSASRRRTVQNAFMSGELRVVVATVAFGMGINKSDIRAVIHFNMPNSFESYVQEVGRAGRDGLPAHCHVFLDSQGRDENELRRHIHANSIDRHVIRKLLQNIFIPCACKGLCPKHEVAFSIEQTVRSLDIPEENIATLLCYLELHENKYIELLNPAYTTCKIISYGGPLQIRKAVKDCPPLAMALALYPPKAENENIIEFPVIEVASAMGWESGICKHKLKNLEWISVNNQPKRSTLNVQFLNLGFRLLAPGNLSDEQLDETLDNLFNRVQNQEHKALKQLHAVHKVLSSVAEKSYMSCVNFNEDSVANATLKENIREYFNSADPLANIETNVPVNVNEEQLINDIRAMICMYRDNQFTGRALARIFHGIQSPNYPAVIWGRCKFWRSHLNEEFHEICRIGTREILRMR